MAAQPNSTQRTLQVPPHSIEAEQSVLGALMLVHEAWDRIADRLTAADFYRREHQLLFTAIAGLMAKGQPVDAVTLADWFDRNGSIADIGGAAYIAELANNTPSAANIIAYADVVRDKSIERQLLGATHRIGGSIFNPEGRSTGDILSEAEQAIFGIRDASAHGRQVIADQREALSQALRFMQSRQDGSGRLSTGFKDLDRLTFGLHQQDLIIVAGRPSMGKTAFAMNVAEAVARSGEKSVLVFSMEMSVPQLELRLISTVSRVDHAKLQASDLSAEEWERVGEAMRKLDGMKIYVDESPALSPEDLRAKARRMAREHGVDLVLVDYLQLMQVPGFKENRATEIAAISRSLKALAKELKIPVIALSQLNRALEQRNDKRPVMSDLRESGAIEQDADLILFLYRDEVYNKDSNWKGTAELIIGKQRNGPIDTVRLTFLSTLTQFVDYVSDAHL